MLRMLKEALPQAAILCVSHSPPDGLQAEKKLILNATDVRCGWRCAYLRVRDDMARPSGLPNSAY